MQGDYTQKQIHILYTAIYIARYIDMLCRLISSSKALLLRRLQHRPGDRDPRAAGLRLLRDPHERALAAQRFDQRPAAAAHQRAADPQRGHDDHLKPRAPGAQRRPHAHQSQGLRGCQ